LAVQRRGRVLDHGYAAAPERIRHGDHNDGLRLGKVSFGWCSDESPSSAGLKTDVAAGSTHPAGIVRAMKTAQLMWRRICLT
jgi:hypothetical protein